MSKPQPFADRLQDVSPGTGVFEGDLKYGRMNGNVPKRRTDFSAARDSETGEAHNRVMAPLVLVSQRDPELWAHDPLVKQAKKELTNSQHGINYMLEAYQAFATAHNSNIHLTVGKQRFH